MRIAMLAHFAGSPRHGMVYGHYFLAREWVRNGHDVTIISASCAHTRFRQPECDGTVCEERIDGIRYLWLRSREYEPADRLGRVVNILSFALRAWRYAGMAGEADAVICSSHHPLAIFAARRLARKHAATLVFEVRDLWPRTLIELGGVSTLNPLIALMQMAENFAYRKADVVVSVLPGAKAYMAAHGMDERKFVYVPNGVALDEDVRDLPERHREILRRLKDGGVFLVGYAGRLTTAAALDGLIRALSRVADLPVEVVVLGDGPDRQRLSEVAVQFGVHERVTFLPALERESVAAFLEETDALYIGLRRHPLFRFGVSPTKLNDYMLAARPVVCAIDAEVEAVQKSGCGIVCDPEDDAGTADAIRRLYRMSEQARRQMGEHGRDWVVANRSYSMLAARFLDAIGAPRPAESGGRSDHLADEWRPGGK